MGPGEKLDPQEKEYLKRAKQYREVFDGPIGKAVLDDLDRRFFYANAGPATAVRGADGHIDPYGTIYHDGSRRVLQHIHGLIELAGNDTIRNVKIQAVQQSTEEMFQDLGQP